MAQPVKAFASIEQQVEILRSRGMMLDPVVAAQWLRSVGYYRLSGYWYPYRRPLVARTSAETRRDDRFLPETNFADVAGLYRFDRQLRTLLHDGIERIEVALRSHAGYLLGSIGPLAYRDRTVFRPTFAHGVWLDRARNRVKRARQYNEAIRHHEAKYGGDLPVWVLTEVLDFSDVSKLYDGLPVSAQWTVAERLGVVIDDSQLSSNQRRKVRRVHPLARWFEQLTVVRNTCAHHARVWNRSFAPAGTSALRTIELAQSLPEGQSERLYGTLVVMGLLLGEISPGTTWTTKVRALVEDGFVPLSGRDPAELGFPARWREDRLWGT